MPQDVPLGYGRTGAALLGAFPGQYRDSGEEVQADQQSYMAQMGQPGPGAQLPGTNAPAYVTQPAPRQYTDPDHGRQFQLQDMPGVGQVVVPVDHTMVGNQQQQEQMGAVMPVEHQMANTHLGVLPKPLKVEVQHWHREISNIVAQSAMEALAGAEKGLFRTADEAELHVARRVRSLTREFKEHLRHASERAIAHGLQQIRPKLAAALRRSAARRPFRKDLSNWRGSGMTDWRGSGFTDVGPWEERGTVVKGSAPSYMTERARERIESGTSGLGATQIRRRTSDPVPKSEAQKAQDYYWAMKNRGLEIASRQLDIVRKWVEIQEMKKKAIEDLKTQVAKSLPSASAKNGVSGLGFFPGPIINWIRQIMGIYTEVLGPAVKSINDLFAPAEEKLRMSAAMFGWLEGRFSTNVVPMMNKIREDQKIGDYWDSWALKILNATGRPKPPYNMKASSWGLSAFSAVSDYMKANAPELYEAKNNTVLANKAGEILKRAIDKASVANELGVPIDQVDDAMKQIGLGITGLEIVLIVALVAALTAGAAAVLYYKGKADAVAKVGQEEIDRITALSQQQLNDLKKKSQAIVSNVAAIQDPAERQKAADQANAAIEQDAKQASAKIQQAAAESKKKIEEAKPPGPLAAFGKYLIPGAAVLSIVALASSAL